MPLSKTDLRRYGHYVASRFSSRNKQCKSLWSTMESSPIFEIPSAEGYKYRRALQAGCSSPSSSAHYAENYPTILVLCRRTRSTGFRNEDGGGFSNELLQLDSTAHKLASYQSDKNHLALLEARYALLWQRKVLFLTAVVVFWLLGWMNSVFL